MALPITFNRLSLIAQLEDILNKAVTLKADYDVALSEWKKAQKNHETLQKALLVKTSKAAQKFNKLSQKDQIKAITKALKSMVRCEAIPDRWSGCINYYLYSQEMGSLPKAPTHPMHSKGKFFGFENKVIPNDMSQTYYWARNEWQRTRIPKILESLALSNADTVTVDSTEAFLQFLGK